MGAVSVVRVIKVGYGWGYQRLLKPWMALDEAERRSRMTRTALVVESSKNVLVKNDDIPSAKASSSRRFWGVKERSYSVANPLAIELSAAGYG